MRALARRALCASLALPALIARHFDSIAASERERQELARKVGDYAKVKELLALRLWPEEYVGALDKDKIVVRVDLEQTVTALVYDLPSVVQNVSPEDMARWKQPRDRLLEPALANTLRKYPVEVTSERLADGVTLTLLWSDGLFGAVHALALENYRACHGREGALMSVPNRQAVICYPINDLETVPAVQSLMLVTLGMYQKGPGSISPHLYWWRQGRYTRLPVSLEDRKIRFEPPKSFLDMLERLPPPAKPKD
jgi:hypothetical protein